MKKFLIACSVIIMLLCLNVTVFAAYLGDIDGNGTLTASDARAILRHSAKLESIAEEILPLADVDKNGNINAADARLALRMGAKLDELIEDHTHDYKTTEIQKQDCEKDGIIEYRCSVCDHSYQDVTKATGHEFIVSIIKEPTCGNGIRQYDCSICGYLYKEDIPANGTEHNYQTTVLKEADCDESGKKEYKCSVCEDTYFEEIKSLGHNYSESVIKEPGCETEGQKTYKCSRCGSSYDEAIAAVGHRYAEATCVKAKTCSVCEKTEGEALGHTTNEGVCDRCGEKISAKQDEIDAENEKHQQNITMINAKFDSLYSIKTETLESLMYENGIYNLYSKSYYQSRYSQLSTEYTNLMTKAAYSSGSAALSYKRQAEKVREELGVVSIAMRCCDLYDEIRFNESARNAYIAEENQRHQNVLQEIQAKYN